MFSLQRGIAPRTTSLAAGGGGVCFWYTRGRRCRTPRACVAHLGSVSRFRAAGHRGGAFLNHDVHDKVDDLNGDFR